jgi:hypothetical protein
MRPLLAAALLAVALAACERRPAPEPAPPRDRPLAEDGTTARAYTSAPDRVKVQLDLAAVRRAVRLWKDEHGTWPASLADVSVEGLSYPGDLRYDPASGAVRSETYPSN